LDITGPGGSRTWWRGGGGAGARDAGLSSSASRRPTGKNIRTPP